MDTRSGIVPPSADAFPRLPGTGNLSAESASGLGELCFLVGFSRFLMAYYVYLDIGTGNLWFWAYLALGIAGFFGETGYVSRRVIRRRTTVSRDGQTTTTVEEEEV